MLIPGAGDSHGQEPPNVNPDRRLPGPQRGIQSSTGSRSHYRDDPVHETKRMHLTRARLNPIGGRVNEISITPKESCR